MKALVTGGAGFIGSNLVEALVGDYEVTILDSLHTGSMDNLKSVQKDVKFIKGSCNNCLGLEPEIKHILARVKLPQTNGKIEKWYHTYEKSRKLFDDFDKFLNWHNSVRYHESLDEKHYLQTPEDAFWARLPIGCKLKLFLSRMESDFNATS